VDPGFYKEGGMMDRVCGKEDMVVGEVVGCRGDITEYNFFIGGMVPRPLIPAAKDCIFSKEMIIYIPLKHIVFY
jgi:hypothetical protein